MKPVWITRPYQDKRCSYCHQNIVKDTLAVRVDSDPNHGYSAWFHHACWLVMTPSKVEESAQEAKR